MFIKLLLLFAFVQENRVFFDLSLLFDVFFKCPSTLPRPHTEDEGCQMAFSTITATTNICRAIDVVVEPLLEMFSAFHQASDWPVCSPSPGLAWIT